MINGNYILILAPEDYPGKKYRNRYCYEHQLVWWQNTGEILSVNEIIHHINKNTHDNRFVNLKKMTRTAHGLYHGEEVPKRFIVCKNCNKKVVQKVRPVQTFCSRRCIGLYSFYKKKYSPVTQ